jgi:hypothetical protein
MSISDIKEEFKIFKKIVRRSVGDILGESNYRKSKEFLKGTRNSKNLTDTNNTATSGKNPKTHKKDFLTEGSIWEGKIKSGKKVKATLHFVVTKHDEKDKNVFYAEMTYYINQTETTITEIKGKIMDDGFVKMKEKIKEKIHDSKLVHPLSFDVMLIGKNIEGSYTFEGWKKGKDYGISLQLHEEEKEEDIKNGEEKKDEN